MRNSVQSPVIWKNLVSQIFVKAEFDPCLDLLYNFYEFEDSHRSRKSRKTTLPHLDSISVAEFRNISRAMWFKQGLEGDYQEVDFLKPKFRLDVTPPTKKSIKRHS